MKVCTSLLLLMFTLLVTVSQPGINNYDLILGKWVHMTQAGPVALEFYANGMVEVDFGNDGGNDLISSYKFHNDTIWFIDRAGEMCSESGVYKLENNDCYLAFDLIEDTCNGRIKMTMGFWTRPDFDERLEELTEKLLQSDNPELKLTRARINLATGNNFNARADLDAYLLHDSINARAYINRAGTRFPGDMEGVVFDCDKAIELEPSNKNAWFLRGLAHYELGEKEKACADFSRAIELGFSILRIAEKQRCHEFWQE